MGNSRDDFTSATKELLANRVGRRCSNPACRKLTCGANTNPEKITNIGVAAHICAAAQGGPRYDASMTPEERKSFENGIWLCQSCSKSVSYTHLTLPTILLVILKNCYKVGSSLQNRQQFWKSKLLLPHLPLKKIKSLSNFIWSALIVQPFKMTFIKKVEWRILIKRLKIR